MSITCSVVLFVVVLLEYPVIANVDARLAHLDLLAVLHSLALPLAVYGRSDGGLEMLLGLQWSVAAKVALLIPVNY